MRLPSAVGLLWNLPGCLVGPPSLVTEGNSNAAKLMMGPFRNGIHSVIPRKCLRVPSMQPSASLDPMIPPELNLPAPFVALLPHWFDFIRRIWPSVQTPLNAELIVGAKAALLMMCLPNQDKIKARILAADSRYSSSRVNDIAAAASGVSNFGQENDDAFNLDILSSRYIHDTLLQAQLTFEAGA